MATVIINEAAINRLLESPDGPVAQFVAQKAQQVALEAQANVRGYFASAPTLTVDQDVDFEMRGADAVVGIRDAGEKARRMARSQADGKVNWLRRALETVRE